MQYADSSQPDPMMRPRIRRRMLEGMGGDPMMDPVSVDKPLMGPGGMPRSGNTGIGGGMNTPTTPMPKLVRDDGSALPTDPNVRTAAPAPAPAPSYQRSISNRPQGVSTEKWLGGHVSPKYAWKEVASQHSLKTAQGRQAALAQLKAQYPQYFANATMQGDKLIIGGDLHPDFQGISLFDVIQDEEGRAIPRWGTPEQDQINQQMAAQQGQGGGSPQRGMDPMMGSQRGMDQTQTSLIDQIRASIMALMGNGQGVG